MRSKRIRTLLRFTATGIILYFLFRSVVVNFDSLRNFPFQVKPGHILASVLCLCGVFFLHSMAWNLILRKLGIRVPFIHSARVYFQGLFGKYIPGKVWMTAIRVTGLLVPESGEAGVKGRVLASVVTEQIYLLTSGLLFAVLVLDRNVFPQSSRIWILAAAVAMNAVAILFPDLVIRVYRRLRKGDGTGPGSVTLNPGFNAACTLWYLLSWLMVSMIVALFGSGFIPIDGKDLLAIGGAYTAGAIIGFIALFAPGGIGVREGVFVILTTPIMSTEVAVTLGFGLRLLWTAAEVTGFGLLYGIEKGAVSINYGDTPAKHVDK